MSEQILKAEEIIENPETTNASKEPTELDHYELHQSFFTKA